jgi:WD40 repeat protein
MSSNFKATFRNFFNINYSHLFVCSGLSNGLTVVWNPLENDIAKRQTMLRENSYDCPIHALSFSSDGRFLASINDISRIVIWSTKVSIINLLVIKFPWNLNFTLFLNVHSI